MDMNYIPRVSLIARLSITIASRPDSAAGTQSNPLSVSIRTVLNVAVRGGERVGLLAQVRSIISGTFCLKYIYFC